MKGFFIAILCLMLLLCSFVSCNHTPNGIESATFDSLTIDTTKTLFSTSSRPACHLVIKMDVPVDPTPKKVCEAIERFVSLLPKDGAFEEASEGSIETMAHAYAKSYIMDYLTNGPSAIDNYDGDTVAAANWMSYEEKVIGKVVYNANSLLSYQVRTESYSGGAHGNTGVDNAVLDLKTLNAIALGDIFTDVSMQEVNKLLRNNIVRQYGCVSMEELEGTGYFFSPNEIEASENFYLDENGITWMYDPYDIAPYSTGEVSVTVSWSDLHTLIAPDSPVQDFANQCSNQA